MSSYINKVSRGTLKSYTTKTINSESTQKSIKQLLEVK